MSEGDLFLQYYLHYLHNSDFRRRERRLINKIQLMRLAADHRLAAHHYLFVVASLRRQQRRNPEGPE